MRLVLRVPCLTPSLNAFVNTRARWRYQTIRAEWERRLHHAWLDARAHGAQPWTHPPHGKVLVTVERVSNRPGLDVDNFVGGLKPVIDALKRMRFLDDDDAGSLELAARQVRHSGVGPEMEEAMTVITLERKDAP
jgi:hypothetical protein